MDAMELRTITNKGNLIASVAFSPDGNTILIGVRDGTARIFDLYGKEMQIFTGQGGGIYGVTFSPDGQMILTGSADQTARLWDIKPSLEEFQAENNYDILSISQKLEFDILDYQNLLKLSSAEDLFAGAQYYFVQATNTGDKTVIQDNLVKSRTLYKKILSKEHEVRYYTGLADVYFAFPEVETGEKKETFSFDVIHNQLLSFNGIEEQKRVLSYYWGKCYDLDDAGKDVELPQKLLEICDYILSSHAEDSALKAYVAVITSDISFLLLLEEEFNLALRVAQLSLLADDTNEYIYINLPLGFLLTGQYQKAEKIYRQWKDKPFTLDPGYDTFSDVFLEDMDDLENRGITHPDFEKVRELLED